jgi:VanZ family protein
VPLPRVEGIDKVAHFGAYLVLGLCLAYGNALGPRFPTFVPLLLGWLYGASDEFHQHFVPGRSVDFYDWVADALGITAGLLLFAYLHRYLAHRNRRRAAPGEDPLTP